jgi:hypothetical protein
MCGNDDMVFMSEGWVTRFLATANAYPDGLFDIGGWTFPAGSFPWSVVSRDFVRRLGFLNDERLLYSDIFLRDVCAAFGRAIMVPEVSILHVGSAAKDANVAKWHLHTIADAYWALHARCVGEAVARLRAVA